MAASTTSRTAAKRHAEADRLALDGIVGALTRAGLYATLLKDWLPTICNSADLKTRGKAQGDYETALTYLKQSLAIQQQIGDKAGLCATLFNMGHLYAQNNQIQEAVSAWVTVYRIAKPMNLAQALQALANLAPRLGLPEGLAGWEALAQQMQSPTPSPSPADAGEGNSGDSNAESELAQVAQLVRRVVGAARTNSPDAPQLFNALSKLAADSNTPPFERELAKVLRQYLSGIRQPDLSALPKAVAELVQNALAEAG